MKTFITILSLFVFQNSFAGVVPQKGYYHAVVATHDEVCDQAIFPNVVNNTLNSLKVYYVGHCGQQGPYYYSCSDNICTDGAIEYNFTKKNQYDWSNLSYDIHATMKYFKKIK